MSSEKITVALFNNGGGMRGLIPAHFMARLEDVTGLRMADMVDIFTGPSTGAILNTALNIPHSDHPTRPRFRARHMVRFYEREGMKIFPRDAYREWRGLIHDFNNRTLKLGQLNALMRHGHYDPSYLLRSLKAMYGDAMLSDSLRSLVIPCYNIDGRQAELVRDNGDGEAHVDRRHGDRGGHAVWLKNIKTGYSAGPPEQTPEVKLYDAVMGSCAAPTYFPCHNFKMRWPGDRRETAVAAIDGNMFDNICISYASAIRPSVPPGHRLIMLALGTGHTNKSVRGEEWNNFGPLGVVDPVNNLPLINVFFHSSESALMDGLVCDMGKDLYIFNKSMVDEPSPAITPSTQIDDASPENLEKMRLFFEAMLEENKNQFDDICHLLVTRRDQRVREDENAFGRARKFFSFFQGLRGSDRTTVADHEAPGNNADR